jgi:steroid Delta-isomerase
VELIRRHVERFNEGVRTGDFGPMLEQFTDDAELVFEGVPVGPFRGRDAIANAYAEQPPDDEVDVLALETNDDGQVVAPYSWRADAGRRSGHMLFTVRDDRIARLVVTFEPAP